MNVSEQGVGPHSPQRHQVVPRTLVFVTRCRPGDGLPELLLLKGSADKRLWANHYNGLGGHVEAGEDLWQAARREVREEAGLELSDLCLRGTVHIDTGREPGVMLAVFRAEARDDAPLSGPEGALAWLPAAGLADYPLVADLYRLIPLVLEEGPIFHGHYAPDAAGQLHYRFRREGS